MKKNEGRGAKDGDEDEELGTRTKGRGDRSVSASLSLLGDPLKTRRRCYRVQVLLRGFPSWNARRSQHGDASAWLGVRLVWPVGGWCAAALHGRPSPGHRDSTLDCLGQLLGEGIEQPRSGMGTHVQQLLGQLHMSFPKGMPTQGR